MPIIDLQKLSGEKVALIDTSAQLTIAARDGSPLPLTAPEARQFQAFLSRNELRLMAVCGGTPLKKRVRVWRPGDVASVMAEIYRTTIWPVLERQPGRASICGALTDTTDKTFWYGGFSQDKQVFVLIPSALYEIRYRELLVQSFVKQLGPDLDGDPFFVASSIEREERWDDPDGGRSSLLVGAAREQALDVAYWLQLAGPEPTEFDERDARRGIA